MPETTSSLSMILPSARWIALRELAQPDLRPLLHHRDVADPQRRAVLGREHGVLDVVHGLDQADFAHVDLLQAASMKLPPALTLLLVSCCSTWPMLSP